MREKQAAFLAAARHLCRVGFIRNPPEPPVLPAGAGLALCRPR